MYQLCSNKIPHFCLLLGTFIPSKDYSEDYMKCINEAKEELQLDARPKIKDNSNDLSKYDVIYLCYPNWRGTFPRIIDTFLESHDFSNEIIYTMCTHEGSGMGRSETELKKLLPNSTIKKCLAIKGTNSHNSDEIIKKWVNE